MAVIKITWLTDIHDCEDCGPSWAEGAIVEFDGEVVLDLEPHAHCYDGSNWFDWQVYEQIFGKLGIAVDLDEEMSTDDLGTFCAKVLTDLGHTVEFGEERLDDEED